MNAFKILTAALVLWAVAFTAGFMIAEIYI